MKILLIDDNLDFLHLCKHHLRKFNKSMNITAISDPTDIVTKFSIKKLQDFDVIISDYQINSLNGVLIRKYLKSKKVITPFILISSLDYEEISKRHSRNICDSFVQKKLIMDDFCQDLIRNIEQIINFPPPISHQNMIFSPHADFSSHL